MELYVMTKKLRKWYIITLIAVLAFVLYFVGFNLGYSGSLSEGAFSSVIMLFVGIGAGLVFSDSFYDELGKITDKQFAKLGVILAEGDE